MMIEYLLKAIGFCLALVFAFYVGRAYEQERLTSGWSEVNCPGNWPMRIFSKGGAYIEIGCGDSTEAFKVYELSDTTMALERR